MQISTDYMLRTSKPDLESHTFVVGTYTSGNICVLSLLSVGKSDVGKSSLFARSGTVVNIPKKVCLCI